MFDWLIGLTVRHIPAFQRAPLKRLRLRGRLKQDATGPYWFRTTTGTRPEAHRMLIIWRNLTGESE